jgi:hypothetical protein
MYVACAVVGGVIAALCLVDHKPGADTVIHNEKPPFGRSDSAFRKKLAM